MHGINKYTYLYIFKGGHVRTKLISNIGVKAGCQNMQGWRCGLGVGCLSLSPERLMDGQGGGRVVLISMCVCVTIVG